MSVQLNFDELLPGTKLTNQYVAKGVTFDEGLVTKDPFAPSAGNAVKLTNRSGPVEFPDLTIKGTFSTANHSHVAVSAGTESSGGGAARLTVFDSLGTEIKTAFIPIDRGSHYAFGEIFWGPANIASFQVHATGPTSYSIDNLIFDDTTVPQAPDFRLLYSGDVLRLGNVAATATIQIVRLHASQGDIEFTASSVPPGVRVEMNTNLARGTDSSFSFRVVPLPGAAAFQNRQLEITGRPLSPLVGPSSRDIAILITILDTYDVQVVGIEVTQAIQVYDLPKKANSLTAGPVSYQAGQHLDLVEGCLTRVRVWSTIRTPPLNSVLPGFECFLTGQRNGVELPHGPLRALNGYSLANGGDIVTDAMRADPLGAAVFTLPPEWTKGVITLTASIEAVLSFIPFDNVDSHPENNKFILTDIPFVPTHDLYFAPFALQIDSIFNGGTDYPDNVLEGARNIMAIGDGQWHAGDYSGFINITDIYNQNTRSCGFLGLGTCSVVDTDRATSVSSRLRDYADDMNFTESGELVVGIFAGPAGPRIRSQESRAGTGPFWDYDGLSVAVFQDEGRPLSSVAHEIGHLLGRKHASAANGADNAEDWPPDQKGFLQGVGFDRSSLRVLFQDRTGGGLGGGGQFFDVMAYSGLNGGNDPDKWISIRGWNENLAAVKTGPPRNAVAAIAGPVSSTGPPTPANFKPAVTLKADGPVDGMVVHANINGHGEATITKIAPTSGRQPVSATASTSSYQIIVHDHQAHVLQTVFARVVPGDTHLANDVNFLEAVIPIQDWTAVSAVEIHHSTTPLVRRERPKSAPNISNIAITPPPDASTSSWTIHWQSQHALGSPLTVKIDYSFDAGTSYRTIFFGPDRGTAVLPTSFLPASTQPNQSLIRIRVSDTFNQTSALSQSFTSPGSPPTVRILDPRRCSPHRAGCAVYLHGSAHDEYRHPLLGEKLRWFLGSRLIGLGATATLPHVQQGLQQIRLEATDARGRKGEAVVEIFVAR